MERTLLNVALENNVGVIINRPSAGGALFRKTKGQQLPNWTAEFECNSWGQFFLKYLLGDPAVTCVIPGTSKVHHMQDNVGAGFGNLPGESQREKMRRLIDAL